MPPPEGWRARALKAEAEVAALSVEFDAMSPEQERLAIEFSREIAGPLGGLPCPPDPVRLLEMAEALWRAEVEDRRRDLPAPPIHSPAAAELKAEVARMIG